MIMLENSRMHQTRHNVAAIGVRRMNYAISKGVFVCGDV